MSSSQPLIACPNVACTNPLNALGQMVCETCQTPLLYRYLRATGTAAAQIAVQTQVAERYYVIAPQIWLDLQPRFLAEAPETLPEEIMPYGSLYPQRLHIPRVYGFCQSDPESQLNILLLENVPLDAGGQPFPTLRAAWSQATAVRQVYWLWQILQMWTPRLGLKVASSLLVADNLRVEGWRVRLQELFADPQTIPPTEAAHFLLTPLAELPSLQALANSWQPLIQTAQATLSQPLQALWEQLQDPSATLPLISAQLNQLLLEQAALLPLQTQVTGASDVGMQRSHNEDTCFPTLEDLPETNVPSRNPLIPHWTIVCDGIGGHEGGEIASQLAVRSLKLQVQALLTEVAEQKEPVAPDLLMEQLEASIRVVNNLIAAQNDAQGRESRQRMGTTLVMALQLPQAIRTPTGLGNTHELYLAHVGDSRAYWITERYCHQLTVDDDVTTREARLGRALYREALQRPDAGSLTQALGTRDGEQLHLTLQRFIIEEDGLLLLCSDGLSDNN
ncbi:MAG: PP2C family serine/threonine-protein phosphatase, partial [Leptolyngbyaceae bacterium]|nr:PP2C family serine/threonine-protein phosphatase [Leptolyngbyaceae bacterium]